MLPLHNVMDQMVPSQPTDSERSFLRSIKGLSTLYILL